MLVTLIVFALAFLWMLKETDFLRVRFYVGQTCHEGDCCQWRFKDEWVTPEMKTELLNLWTNLPKETLARFKSGIESPLCGWGYAWQYHDLKPEYKIELLSEHSKITMQTESLNILKDCFKVYRNPYAKVKLSATKTDAVF